MSKLISVKTKSICKNCKRPRATINDLCDACTIKKFGKLMPWLDTYKEKIKST